MKRFCIFDLGKIWDFSAMFYCLATIPVALVTIHTHHQYIQLSPDDDNGYALMGVPVTTTHGKGKMLKLNNFISTCPPYMKLYS